MQARMDRATMSRFYQDTTPHFRRDWWSFLHVLGLRLNKLCTSSRCHIPSNPIPAEMIRPAVRAEILPPKTPDLLSRLARTVPDSVGGLFAAEKMPATAHVGIDGFVEPGEVGADLVDVGVTER